MKTNLAHKLEQEGPTKTLVGIVAHSERGPELVYRLPYQYRGTEPLEAALLKDDYKHTPSGVY